MWFTASSVTATNNSNVVKLNSNESIVNVKPGDALIIGSFNPVEILKAYASDQGSFIQLAQSWKNATQSQVPALVLPTRSALNEAITAINGANKLVNDNYKAILDWQTKTGEVTFKNLDNQEVTVKTAKQLELDVKAVQPYPWAIRKVEFEALRQQNLEKYEASGFVSFGEHYDAGSQNGMPINQGMWTRTATSNIPVNSFLLGRGSGTSSSLSKTKFPVVNMAGVVTALDSLSHDQVHDAIIVKLPPAEDGMRTYDSATGITVTHATSTLAFAAETATNKVVINRVDMYGFELFLRVITANDPYVYDKGNIHSQAASINGVSTTDDTVRPIEYFAWYEGDTTSRGRGVNWQTATEAQRIAIASDPKNNIYFDDATGKFYQWCVRGRSFAGLGNGDWSNIDIAQPVSGWLGKDQNNNRIVAQGNSNDDSSFAVGGSASNLYKSPFRGDYDDTLKGVYQVTKTISGANSIDSKCYFLVCGTVNRLNQGCYHPFLNPFGTSKFHKVNEYNKHWDQLDGTEGITTQADCFIHKGTGYLVNDGGISRGVGYNGRPDGRYYDAIYASGAGGVCRDMRFKADGLSLAELAEHDLKVKSGEYRGVEKLTHCRVYDIPSYSSLDSGSFPSLKYIDHGFQNLTGNNLALGENYLVFNNDTNEFFDSDSHQLNAYPAVARHIYYPARWGASSKLYVIYFKQLNTSIAGEYMHADVFGNPVDILQNADLQDGWIGGYSPDLTDGNYKEFKFTRPVLSFYKWGSTSDNGANWSIVETTPSGFDAAKNSRTLSKGAGSVYIYQYKTEAKTTKSTSNSPVYGGKKGVGSVYATSAFNDSRARGLGFNLTGNINTSSAYLPPLENHSADATLADFLILDGEISQYHAKHAPLSLGIPNNGSPAFKALNYVTEINGQAFICYAYAELHYDSTAGNWGDDGQVHIVDGQSSIIDLNGHTVKVGTAIIVEPLGWVKNAA